MIGRPRGIALPFSYYDRLSPRRQRIYRRSDELTSVPLPRAAALQPLVAEIRSRLEGDDRRGLTRACQQLIDGIVERLEVPPLQARVLAARPSRTWGELHGLYEPEEEGRSARLTVWMRTAQQRRIVAFATFLRTVLHELCHHLDYELYEMAETFHTEGFFKRESSLYHQLVGPAPSADGAAME